MNTPAPQVEMVSELQRLSERATQGRMDYTGEVHRIRQVDTFCECGDVAVFVDSGDGKLSAPIVDAEFIAKLVNWFRENQAALNARAGGGAKDAERYRGLRHAMLSDDLDFMAALNEHCPHPMNDEEFDAAIDAALASQAVGVKGGR